MQAEASINAQILSDAFARGASLKRSMLGVEGGVLPSAQFALRAGLAKRDLEKTPLLWLAFDDDRAYPAFQISGDRLLPGMTEVVRAFRIDDPWMRINFMLTGDARLSGSRPIDALREGRVNEVMMAAEAYGDHGAA